METITVRAMLFSFLVKNTVEVGIQLIQQKKLQLASDVLSGSVRAAVHFQCSTIYFLPLTV